MAAAHLLTATFHSVNLRSPVPHAGHQLGGTHRREALARKKKKKKKEWKKHCLIRVVMDFEIENKWSF